MIWQRRNGAAEYAIILNEMSGFVPRLIAFVTWLKIKAVPYITKYSNRKYFVPTSTEYAHETSVFVNRIDPRNAEIATRMVSGRKKLPFTNFTGLFS
jgi:hypothetical protein